jgi:NAD(P)-dependent dehydrogenase (short-subunit alcohol dehydrogenase family)
MFALSALHGASSTIYSNLFVTLPVPKADLDLSEQVIIVTGSNTGLGLEASRHLSQLGLGKLIMAVRTISKGEEAKKDILASTYREDSTIEVWPLDMDNYESIKAFANRASQLPRIDGVLANAGVMTAQFGLSEGIEKTLNVNVVSTFLLYLLLLPKMRESGQHTGSICRFVIPNSALHYMAPITELEPKDQTIMERLNDAKKSDMASRYPLSKLLVIYAVREFAQRAAVPGKEPSVIVNTPNPSFCKSSLAKESQESAGFRVAEKLLARSTEEGSRALVHGLIAGKESNGEYLTNCHVHR